jgi:transposase-like protein
MSGVAHTCPRCQTEMAPGAVRTTTRSSLFDPFAVAGSNRVRWVGEDRQQFRLQAYRCASCGFVELSATERPAPSGCLGMVLLLAGLGLGVGVAAGRWLVG